MDNCLTLCSEHSTLTKEKGDWTKFPALQNKMLQKIKKKAFIELFPEDKKNAKNRIINCCEN